MKIFKASWTRPYNANHGFIISGTKEVIVYVEATEVLCVGD